MKRKIKLNQLQVKSFVTSLNSAESMGIMGASGRCLPTEGACITPSPQVRSVHADCPFTRVDNNCVGVAITSIC